MPMLLPTNPKVNPRSVHTAIEHGCVLHSEILLAHSDNDEARENHDVAPLSSSLEIKSCRNVLGGYLGGTGVWIP